MPIIELKNISKEYRSETIVSRALNSIDLTINRGEFVAVMGASGSGKTTLLNILGCMDTPTSGKYFLDGVEISHAGEKKLSEIRGKRIAFVFQHFALIEDYTLQENVEVPLLKQGISRLECRQKALNALNAVGIAELVKKRPCHISGGQKQRAAIARAIACGAEIILADEPTGALDSKTGKEIMRLFSTLNDGGKTIIVITHDRSIAEYAQRLITLSDAEIISDEKLLKGKEA